MSEKIKADGQTFSAETWHNYCKAKFLGGHEVRLPNRKTITIYRSTADLDKEEFTDYMTNVEALANEHGAFLEDDVFS